MSGEQGSAKLDDGLDALRPSITKLLLQRYLRRDDDERTLDDPALPELGDQELTRKIHNRLDELSGEILASLRAPVASAAEDVQPSLARAREALDTPLPAELLAGKVVDPVALAQALEAAPRRLPALQVETEKRFASFFSVLVRCLVEIAVALPTFDARGGRASASRLSHFVEEAQEILKAVQRVEKRALWDVAHQDPRAARLEADYRHAVVRELDFVELFGADLSEESSRHSLSVAYVSLDVEGADAHGDECDAAPLPSEDLLDSLNPDAGRLIIRGAAGSGKTTLLRWTAIQSAGRAPESHGLTYKAIEAKNGYLAEQETSTIPPNRAGIASAELPSHQSQRLLSHTRFFPYWRVKVPFLVRLRDCTHGRLGAPDHFPTLLASGTGKPDATWVTSVLEGGRALVLLDGIDEIPTKKRESLRKELQAIIERFPDTFYVVSTRPEAVPRDWLRTLGFREARVRPMSNADKQVFIDRWHTAVAEQLRRRGRTRDADGMSDLARELKGKLPGEASINRLAEVPLLCAMICALHRERHQRLPESQWELCEALCLMLLHRRERESGLDLSEFPESYRGLLYEQKRAIVRELAHSMVRNGVSALDVTVAEERVAHVLRSFPAHSPGDAPVVCKSLVERSGMLREARPDVIDFIHNTFKEFLAAEVFIENGDVKLLVDHATEEAWQQVVIFAAATRNPKFASHLVKTLLRRPSARNKSRERKAAKAEAEAQRARQLLALRCRAVALHLDPDLREQLDDLVGELFPPRTMADAEALAAGGEVAVRFLRYRKDMRAAEAAACVRALSLIDTPSARTRMREFLRDTRTLVVAALAQNINPLEIATVQQIILSGECLPISVARQVRDISLLSSFASDAERIDLSSTNVADLSVLTKLHRLRDLDISSTPVSSIDPIAHLSQLEILSLAGTEVDDISAIRNLVNLKELMVAHTTVFDLSPIRQLSQLRRMSIYDTPVRDIDVLCNLRQLQGLWLGSTNLCDFTAIAHLTELQQLHLHETPIADLTVLSGLRNLKTLSLSRTLVSDLSPISSLKNLEWIDISGTRVKDLSALAALPLLRYVYCDESEEYDFSSLLEAVRSGRLRVYDANAGLLRVLDAQGEKMSTTITAPAARYDVGILIALPEEFAELQRHVPRWTTLPSQVPGKSYYIFERPGPANQPPYRCIATFIGKMGPTSASLSANDFLWEHPPATAVMLGIAGALNDDVRVGDVVLADTADLYLAASKAVPNARGFLLRHGGEVYRSSQE
ncbi:MAG TPA: NACHT domain-containing protein, partial [Sorangium sp.]|nr:NACHT domain-containing protein [Sorangium sp.]